MQRRLSTDSSSSWPGAAAVIASAGHNVTVNVTLRLRPQLSHLDADGDALSVHPVEIDGRSCSFKGVAYKFSHCYDGETSTPSIFDVHRDAVLGVLNGFDATLMAYGTTGSGKTHTMIGTDEHPGLTPLAIDALFERIAAGGSSGQTYALQVSAMELVEERGERCVDLLHGRAPVVLRSAPKSDGGLSFHGLKEVPVTTKANLLEVVRRATAERTTMANYRHDASSRSHLIVRLRVDGARLMSIEAAPATAKSAGSESGSESGATGAEPLVDAAHGTAADGAAADGAASDAATDGATGGGNVSLKDATSATLTLIDLAGSEAALLNANATAVAQASASRTPREKKAPGVISFLATPPEWPPESAPRNDRLRTARTAPRPSRRASASISRYTGSRWQCTTWRASARRSCETRRSPGKSF